MNMVLRRLHRLSLSSAFCSHSHTHTLPPPLTHSLTRSLAHSLYYNMYQILFPLVVYLPRRDGTPLYPKAYPMCADSSGISFILFFRVDQMSIKGLPA